ncbi:MAG: hypothetical protein Q7S40_30685 [Opitutaceae bacterium]|nr:hypothetical protein [Opitutaceae bacterium]
MTDSLAMPSIEPAAGDRRSGSVPILPADEVAFWTVALDGQPAGVLEFMAGVVSAAEAERARQFRFERDRRRFVLGRGILRTILGRYLDQPAERIELRYGANGKPMLAGDAPEPRLHFNVAPSFNGFDSL